MLRHGGLIFAASPTGNRVIAYDPVTRWTAALELNATKENPLKVSFSANDFAPGPVALRIAGAEIRRIAAFDLKSRTWHAHDLAEPVKGQAIPYPSGDGSIAYDLGRHLYTFNTKSLAWDHLDVSAIPDAAGDSPKDGAKPGRGARSSQVSSEHAGSTRPGGSASPLRNRSENPYHEAEVRTTSRGRIQ